VVLLTPDDTGKGAKEEGEPRPRARQNVILELGYFLAKLGRSNVAILFHESVELPSDYRGVEYIKVDAEGAWRMKLARDLKVAGLPVDMNNAA
jgi:predicted nucleotide-binding protein